jgi:hypothetical protein
MPRACCAKRRASALVSDRAARRPAKLTMEKRVPTIEELLAPDGAAKERWAQLGPDVGYDYADAALHETHALLAALHFHFSERSSHNEADRFFAGLMSGAGLPAKDPVAVLKKKLDADIRRRARRREAPNRRNLATWIILAWKPQAPSEALKKLPPHTHGEPQVAVIE